MMDSFSFSTKTNLSRVLVFSCCVLLFIHPKLKNPLFAGVGCLLLLKCTVFLVHSKQNYIVNCQKHVRAPAYLRNRLRGQVTFDLTPIMKKGNMNSTGR